MDGNKNYADGRWHNIVARRDGTNAYITIDGVFKGTREMKSDCCGGSSFGDVVFLDG